jgi:hypothetical protein
MRRNMEMMMLASRKAVRKQTFNSNSDCLDHDFHYDNRCRGRVNGMFSFSWDYVGPET